MDCLYARAIFPSGLRFAFTRLFSLRIAIRAGCLVVVAGRISFSPAKMDPGSATRCDNYQTCFAFSGSFSHSLSLVPPILGDAALAYPRINYVKFRLLPPRLALLIIRSFIGAG